MSQAWLKVMHRFDAVAQRDVGDPHRLGPLGQPLMRPSYAPGDPLLIYLAGTLRCPAVCEVTDEPWFDGEQERWGWRTPVRVLGACATADAPSLADVGLPGRAVGRQARLRLRPEQFGPAAAQVLRASSSAMSS